LPCKATKLRVSLSHLRYNLLDIMLPLT